MVTVGEMQVWNDVGRLAAESKEQTAHLSDISAALIEMKDGRYEDHPLNDRDEESPLMRIAEALERIALALEPKPTVVEHTPTASEILDGPISVKVPVTSRHKAGTWHVEDNVTGKVESKDFDTLASAEQVCWALNADAGPGGRYGVYDSEGKRV
jgi:hypothetical protein